MSWMDRRRIRRVRKPTKWEAWVAQWHEWLDDALEKAVCCGVDPTTIADVADATRFPLSGKRGSSSVFSMNSAYRDDSMFDDEDDSQSETDSETADSIDMNDRDSTVEMDGEASDVRERATRSSEYIPFEDEDDSAPLRCGLVVVENELHHRRDQDATCVVAMPQRTAATTSTSASSSRDGDDRRYHRALFNCILVELLSTLHPVGWR